MTVGSEAAAYCLTQSLMKAGSNQYCPSKHTGRYALGAV